MSVLLVDLVVQMLREAIPSPDMLKTVQPYGGEFNAEEVDTASFTAPAVLVASMGWAPPGRDDLLAGAQASAQHLAAFVVTKNAKRVERMAAASALAETVARALKRWRPQAGESDYIEVAAVDWRSVQGENLYGSRLDKKGLALWVVRWKQCVQDKALTPEQEARLGDLLRVSIHSDAVHGQGAEALNIGDAAAVSQEIGFKRS